MTSSGSSEPDRELDGAQPIPTAWRPLLRAVVNAFVEGDYALARNVPGVESPSPETVEELRDYVVDYGATLAPLPDASWDTSFTQWTGSRWDIMLDLWTVEEGRSDMVLRGWITELADGPRFEVHVIYVP